MRRISVTCLGLLILFLFAASAALLVNSFVLLEPDNFPLQQRWSAELPGGVEALSSAALASGGQIVFARTRTTLFALDGWSGKTLWSLALGWYGATDPVVAWGETAFFTDGEDVWAVNAADGALRWKADLPNHRGRVRSVSADGVAVESDQDVALYDARDGTLLWSKAACRNQVQAYVDAPYVYVPCDSIRAIELSTGEEAWAVEQSQRIINVTYQDGVMYYSPASGGVAAFDLHARSLLWETPMAGDGFRQFRALGDVLAVTDRREFCLFERASGRQRWCADHSAPTPQNPTRLGQSLYVFNGYQTRISAYDLATGRAMGDLTVRPGEFFTVYRELMTTANHLLVFAAADTVFAYGE